MHRSITDQVRSAAAGRWFDILTALGFPADILDGEHHACPKCGGTDRFRMIDRQAGAVLCNQCLVKRNGDGFAAIQWYLGCDFPEAAKKVADYLGIATERKKKADPAADLEWRDWSSELAAFFIQSKPGVTEAAILAAGGRMARYKRSYSVIAFPIIGESLDTSKPVGWVIVNAMGGMLPKWNKDGEVVGQVKTKVTYGSGPGLIGLAGIERIKTDGLVEVVWKTEGLSDLLATTSAIPQPLADRHVAVTNSNGARQHMGWMAGLLARFDTRVLHDCDEPGQVGAAACCQEIAMQGGKSCCNVVLPYVIEKNHGKDVRDWLNEGNTYTNLEALASRSQIVAAPQTEDGEIDYSQATFPIQENILRKLQIEVLYETEDGRIRIFSWLLRKSSWISAAQVDRIKKEKLVQICGPPAMAHTSTDPDGETSWSIGDVRTAIALMASARREEHNERGIGVWQGQDERENEIDTIVLANDTEASKWNGAGTLERVVTPRSEGLVLDFGSGHRDWYDHAELNRYIEESKNADWVLGVLESVYAELNKWRWKNQDYDPALVCGLIMATWVQTIWTWRPLVVVIGESNSGKSLLFEALGGSHGRRGIFGNLAFKQAKSTEAGIRQGIGNTARIVLCDEFEKSRERDKVLEMMRASTRGETISRGTSDQRGTSFSLRHIGWVAAIEAGLHRQPDINRFVQLELLRAESLKQGHLALPDGDQLYRLGQKLLAISVTCAAEAKKLAVRLKREAVIGIDARTVEVYAVPASMLSVALRNNEEQAKLLLRDVLKSVDATEQGRTDHDELLADIMSALVNCGGKDGFLTVGQIIDSPTHWYEHAGRLEAQGISLKGDGEARYLIVAHKQVASKLLKTTAWEGQRIDQVLLRCQGATRAQATIGGGRPRVIEVPLVSQAPPLGVNGEF